MDVPVTALRANLREWLSRAGQGEEIVVTDHGTPIARIVGVDAATTIERLTAEGVLSRPEVADRPKADRRSLVRSRTPVSPYVEAHRR